jgi:type II secretory pathway pseudopilin PulG
MGLGQGNRGYAMAALLVGMSIMAILMSAAMPTWATFAKREKEAELFWRLGQYARAVGLFQRKYANTFPPNVDILVEQRFLRKKYKDPITGEDFQPIPAGGGQPPVAGQPPRPQPSIGIQGVVSKSTATALRTLNGRSKYNEWIVVPVVTTPQPKTGDQPQRPGTGPGAQPGPPGPFQRGGTTFTPAGGSDRRPPVPVGVPPPRPPGN